MLSPVDRGRTHRQEGGGPSRHPPGVAQASLPRRRGRSVRAASNVLALLSALAATAALEAQQTGAISGRVIDEASLEPVVGVLVRVRSTELSAVTAADGRFEIASVPVGLQVIQTEHLAYGERLWTVQVEAGETAQLQARWAARPVVIDSLTVQGRTELEQRRISTGFSMNEIQRSAIDEAARRGLGLWELLRDAMPSVRVTQQSLGFISCVEFRGAVAMTGACQQMAIFVDGVYMSSPGTIPPNMPLNDIERVEAISPGQAGVQYGTLGGNGVLLIETRTGTRPDRPSAREISPGFDWSAETQPYALKKVMGAAFVGNAVGLAVGMAAGNQCLHAGDHGALAVREGCNGLKTVALSAVALTLPSLMGSYAARWGGTTDRSHGRVLPATIMGALPAVAGYLLILNSETTQSSFQRASGLALLGVASPLLITFSDRVFRALR